MHMNMHVLKQVSEMLELQKSRRHLNDIPERVQDWTPTYEISTDFTESTAAARSFFTTQ